MDIWEASLRSFQKSDLDGPEFFHIAEALYEKCGGEDFCLFSETAMKVRLRKNAWVHEGSFLHPDIIVWLAGGALEDFLLANRVVGLNNVERVDRKLKWVRPVEGWTKVNVDAVLVKMAGRMGFGVIMRDDEGKVIAAKCISRSGLWESSAAEALVAYYGAIFCQERGVSQLILQGDAKQITDAIQANGRDASSFGQLVDDVLQCLHVFPKWQIRHVNHEANRAAHSLAKWH